MNPTSQKIFYYLINIEHSVTSECLANHLGLKNARSLRSNGKDGILEVAADEIFEETGYVLLRTMKNPRGIKLSKDVEEIEHTLAEWNAWLWHAKKNTTDFYERALKRSQSFFFR